MNKKQQNSNETQNPELGISDVRQRLLDRIKEIEDGKEEYRTSGKNYSPQGRLYWEGGYLEVLKDLKTLFDAM